MVNSFDTRKADHY